MTLRRMLKPSLVLFYSLIVLMGCSSGRPTYTPRAPTAGEIADELERRQCVRDVEQVAPTVYNLYVACYDYGASRRYERNVCLVTGGALKVTLQERGYTADEGTAFGIICKAGCELALQRERMLDYNNFRQSFSNVLCDGR